TKGLAEEPALGDFSSLDQRHADDVAGHGAGGEGCGVAAFAPDGVGRVRSDPEHLDAARNVAGTLVLRASGLFALRDEGGDERKVGRVGTPQVGAGKGVRNRMRMKIRIRMK